MMHYSCDVCGCKLKDERFVVRLDIYPAFDPDAISADDLEQDNLTELSELLSDFEATGEMNFQDSDPTSFRYDLCSDCHRNYRKDPLALHRPGRMRFSEN